jgi:hypothetical protein
MSVTLPSDISDFLSRRAERDNASIPDTLVAIVAKVMADEEAELPQWEKDFIDSRLDMAKRFPDRLKPIKTLLETL